VRVHYRLAGDDVAALYAQLQQVARTHQAETERARTAYLGSDDIDELTREQLLERVAAGDATVIDVRPAEEYTAGHIPGALSIPLDELETRLAELPDAPKIVAYCRGANCVLAHDAVRLLNARGRHALRLADGMLEWRLAQLPVQAGAA
jgi:rhodanese-related sulfurtransferase